MNTVSGVSRAADMSYQEQASGTAVSQDYQQSMLGKLLSLAFSVQHLPVLSGVCSTFAMFGIQDCCEDKYRKVMNRHLRAVTKEPKRNFEG